MIEPIVPAALKVRDEPGDFITNTAKESALRTAARLATDSTVLTPRAQDGSLKIVAAIYDLETGVVSWLD